MDVPKGLILEIGGGSSKIIYYNRRNLLNYETLPFGAVTLTDLFGGDEKTTINGKSFFKGEIRDCLIKNTISDII